MEWMTYGSYFRKKPNVLFQMNFLNWSIVQSKRNSVQNIHWEDCWWSWSSNTLATWCKELTHWKRPWCWERLKAGGKGGGTEWDDWMASPTQWTWYLSELQETVKDRGAWPGVSKSRTWLSDWTTTTVSWQCYVRFWRTAKCFSYVCVYIYRYIDI